MYLCIHLNDQYSSKNKTGFDDNFSVQNGLVKLCVRRKFKNYIK